MFLFSYICPSSSLASGGNLLEGVGEVASSTSRDFHLGKNLLLFLENSDIGMRLLALRCYCRKESCCTSANNRNM